MNIGANCLYTLFSPKHQNKLLRKNFLHFSEKMFLCFGMEISSSPAQKTKKIQLCKNLLYFSKKRSLPIFWDETFQPQVRKTKKRSTLKKISYIFLRKTFLLFWDDCWSRCKIKKFLIIQDDCWLRAEYKKIS